MSKEIKDIPQDFKIWYIAESRKQPQSETFKEWKRRGQQLCYEVAHTEGYQEAAEAAYRHLSSSEPAKESQPVFGIRWESEKSPEKPGKYYCGVKVDGDFEKHIIDWDGNSWGCIEDYDRYDDLEIIEWLHEKAVIAPAPQPEPSEDRKETISKLEQIFKDKAEFLDDWIDHAALAYDFFHGLVSSPPSEEKEDSLHKTEWNSLTESQKNDFINNSLGRTADGNKSMFIHTDKGTVEASEDLNESIGKIETALNTQPSPPSVKPERGDSDWAEASTPPDKDGFYNVITEANCLIIDTYEQGKWSYDLETDEIGTPDRVIRYRPSTWMPLQEPDPQPSPAVQQEDGEVPEEIGKWIDSIHDGRWGFRPGAIAMYHKMQEEINGAKVLARNAEAEENRLGELVNDLMHKADSLQFQLSAKQQEVEDGNDSYALLEQQLEDKETEHKELIKALLSIEGEKCSALRQEKEDYRNALEETRGTTDAAAWNIVYDILKKYPTPQKPTTNE